MLPRMSTADLHFSRPGGEPQELLLRVPKNFSELRAVRRTLALYQQACPGQIAVLLLAFYLFLQVYTPAFFTPCKTAHLSMRSIPSL